MSEGKKEKKTSIFDIVWMSIKLTVVLLLLPIIVGVLVLVGSVFLPVAIFAIPIIFIACLLVMIN